MAKLSILEFANIDVLAQGATGEGQQNLLDPDPRSVWVHSDSSFVRLGFNLDAPQELNCGFVGNVRAGLGEAIRILSFTEPNAGGTATPAGIKTVTADMLRNGRGDIWIDFDAPVTTQYLGIDFLGGGGVVQEAGVLGVGNTFEAEWDREFGGGRNVIDTGRATDLRSGGFGIQPGTRKMGYSFTFGDLTDDEAEELTDMKMRVGSTIPIAVNENPDLTTYRRNRLHYGLFRNLRRFERREPGATKWQMELVEWA